jgi:hypothetical protein
MVGKEPHAKNQVYVLTTVQEEDNVNMECVHVSQDFKVLLHHKIRLKM